MRFRLSYKDLLLALGILVAVIISVTTWMYAEQEQEKKTSETPTPPKTSLNTVPSVLLKKVLEKVELKTQLGR